MSKHLQPAAITAKELLEPILHSPSLLNREWLAKRGWTAVPIEQPGYVSRRDLERLLKATTQLGLESGIVAYPTDIDADPQIFSFLLSNDALGEAAHVQAFSYLISTVDFDFLYHKTNEDFTLIAGPYRFVELAVGASVEAAQRDWRQFCCHPGWSESEKHVYEDVADWYEALPR